MKSKYMYACFISLFLIVVSLSAPLAVNASKNQSSSSNNYIKVETLDSVWLDGNSNIVSKIELPEYMAPGEEIKLNGGLKIKNVGVNCYARFKAECAGSFDMEISASWVKGNDEYYYYCAEQSKCVVNAGEVVQAIDKLFVSSLFTNDDKNKELTLRLTLEVVDSSVEDWKDGWKTNPPEKWFDLI